jgi:dephospho-CoA kinase
VRLLVGGGIGSGKSAFGRFLARRGATVVDSDRLGHRVLEPGAEAYDPVASRWPQVIVDGRVDRAALASIVFDDPDALADLEAISHPAIVRRIESIAAATDAPLVVEVPLMLPIGNEGWVRVFVDAPAAVRLGRAVERGADREDTIRRMGAQAGRDDWIAWADHVIDNGGGVDDLERAVDRLWSSILPTTG